MAFSKLLAAITRPARSWVHGSSPFFSISGAVQKVTKDRTVVVGGQFITLCIHCLIYVAQRCAVRNKNKRAANGVSCLKMLASFRLNADCNRSADVLVIYTERLDIKPASTMALGRTSPRCGFV